jgi:hypothetical protein
MHTICANFMRVVHGLPRSLLRTALFVGMCLLHAGRIPGHFLHCTPFSEEGFIFLAANVQGRIEWTAAGYINLFSSLVIWLSSIISIYWTPWITTLIAVPLTVACFAYLLLPHWERLLPLRYRASLVVFFLLFSPVHEGIAICLYCFWYFAIGSIWLLIEATYLPDDFRKHRVWKLLFVLVGGLSGAAAMQVALSYLAAFTLIAGGWRSLPNGKARRRDVATPRIARWSAQWTSRVLPATVEFLTGILRVLWSLLRNPLLWTIAVGIVVQSIAMHYSAAVDSGSFRVQWWRFLPATLYQINMRVLTPSLIGVRATEWVNESRVLSCLMLGGLLAMCAFILRQRRTFWRGEVAMVLLMSAMFSTWVLYLGRPSIFGGFRSKPWRVEMNAMRYSLIPLVFFISSLVVAFDCWNPLPGVKRKVLRLALPLLLVAGILNYPSIVPAPDVGWAETAAQLEDFRAGRRNKIERRLHPDSRLSITRPAVYR